MELISLCYFAEATKDLNFTQTAHRLYISQQTLSNHILRLEREYQVQLFERRPRLALTAAGEHFLSYAEAVLAKDAGLRRTLMTFGAQDRGILRVGAPPHRASLLLPEILPAFVDAFPMVQLEFRTYLSHRLEDMLQTGEIDLAIGAFSKSAQLEQAAFLKDIIYITVSDQLLCAHYGSTAQELKARSAHKAHVEDFAELPFILPAPENRQSEQLRTCFSHACIRPKCFMATTFPQFFFPLCRQGLAALFLSETYFYSYLPQMDQTINRFPLYLEEQPLYHTVSVAYRKGRQLPRYVKRFIEIIAAHFERLEQQRQTFL